MKKRTISKLKSIFGHKSKSKGKRQQSRTPSPALEEAPSTETFRPVARTPTPPARPGLPPSPPVPTQPKVPGAAEPSGPLALSPCPVCGRTFVPESLSKHVKICEKTLVKKRKTFDSSRQRREGTDLDQFLPKNFGLPENSPFLEKSPPQTAKSPQKPLKPSVRQAIQKPTSDLQRCPHCNRAFGPRAFERHVEWCGDKAKILPAAPAHPPPHVADAKQRLNARTQYKAPLVRGRRSSQTRERSSNSRSASVESSRGVSPPPPPRESGDFRRGRSRASESSDCQEDAPHVPVIRATRNAQPVDAVTKARQARLARDLSSSRVDDTYDPFLSAARQMKELMSSETNIPKKIQSTSKDHTRTLPSLRNAKEKSSYFRPDNTKLMKDTINKTYQKTPTLQRMKSFGSTNNDNINTFGGRSSSFRLNRSDTKKSSQKLNTTFTKSSKENISTVEKSTFNRNSNLNRSFSSYTASAYSTPKPKDKIPKISTSLYHSFQRTTIKQPIKLDKIKKEEPKPDFVTLDLILADDNSSLTDSTNYIDPRLINENDNLPINVNTILNNPDMISSMESLLTTENLPAKFESFSANATNSIVDNNKITKESQNTKDKADANNFSHSSINKTISNNNTPIIDDLSAQYDKLMSSLEQSIASKTSIRDDESLCEDFDLEEFMTSFDDEIKQKTDNKRTYSSTTRVVKQSQLVDSKSELNSNCATPKIVKSGSNGAIPFNKSMSLTFNSNNLSGDTIFPSSVKRSTSLLDSIQKKTKCDNGRSRHKADQLEQDIMQSLKEFDKFYENGGQPQEIMSYNVSVHHNGTAKRDSRVKPEKKSRKDADDDPNGNYTANGKSSDSAYSSLNRISPSKLSICTPKEAASSDQLVVVGSDSSNVDNGIRSVSSDEFLAMERSAELDEPIQTPEKHTRDVENHKSEKRTSSRASSRHSGTWRAPQLSSSGSDSSLPARQDARTPLPAPRPSRFCHECGSKFSVEAAKFCMECGVKRLVL